MGKKNSDAGKREASIRPAASVMWDELPAHIGGQRLSTTDVDEQRASSTRGLEHRGRQVFARIGYGLAGAHADTHDHHAIVRQADLSCSCIRHPIG